MSFYVRLVSGSYTSHPYIYTLTPTFDTKFYIYPLYKIKLNHLFTPTFFFLLKNITNIHPTFFWERTHKTNNKHYINLVLPKTFNLIFLPQSSTKMLLLIVSPYGCVCSLNRLRESLIEV